MAFNSMRRTAGVAKALTDRDAWPAWWVLGGWTLIAAVAVGASSLRLVAAPGVEFYLAAFFYLLAYRWFGLWGGLLAALILTLPTLFWWGHVFSVVLAVANVLFVHLLSLRLRSLALKTLLFYLTVGGLSSYLFLRLHYDAPGVVIQLGVLRKTLTDVTLAALVDLLGLALRRDPRTWRLRRRERVWLTELLSSSVLIIAMIAGAALFIANVRGFGPAFETTQQLTRNDIEIYLLREGAPEAGSASYIRLGNPHEPAVVGLSTEAWPLVTPAGLSRLECDFVHDLDIPRGANDSRTFAYWLDACVTGEVAFDGQEYHYIYATAPLARALYGDLLTEFRLPAGVTLALMGLVVVLQMLMQRSLRTWTGVVGSFGTPDLRKPDRFSFAEFQIPMDEFVRENNRQAELLDERRRLVAAVEDLQSSINLRLLSDIRFEESSGLLHYRVVNLQAPDIDQAMEVHPNDAHSLNAVENEDNPYIEFRAADRPDSWYLLLVRGRQGNRWESGCLFELRQHKIGRETQMQQARLMELGGMASALSHELKQPLFTISLSAENADFVLEGDEAPRVVKAREKLKRIDEQVGRARSIIDRISRYARIDESREEVIEVVQTIRAAASFVRPLLVQKNVRLHIDAEGVRYFIRTDPVGLEQVVVNALQNAVDAIESRREEDGSDVLGTIEIQIEESDRALSIEMRDNGTGLLLPEGAQAFDAFTTTKERGKGTGLGLYISRQIIADMDGRIAISSRQDGVRGAKVVIELPPGEGIEPDQLQAAQGGMA